MHAQPSVTPPHRQLPEGDEIFLDHTGFFVRDLAQAGAALERLGFQVSAVNVQTNAAADGTLVPSGTSNRLARLREGYLEILTASHETPLAEQLKTALDRYEGLHLIALSHDDIPAQRERLAASGFAMQPVIALRRRDKTLPGAPEVAWSVLRPEPGIMVEGRIQFAKSHNPELVWQSGLTAHANAADALSDIVVCVPDQHEAAARYSLYVGRPSLTTDDLTTLPLDRGRIVLAGPHGAELLFRDAALPSPPFMAGQAIRSADLAVTRAVLDRAGVKPVYADDTLICVGPQDALGAFLLFHSGAAADPWAAFAAR